MPLVLLLFACSAPPDASDAADPSDTDDDATPVDDCLLEPPPEPEVVAVVTEDGVALEADRYAGLQGQPGFVLLHMIPPASTRADWPRSFIDALTCQGWSVIALDRRGAGGSGGNPVDSYEGEGGRLDVAAAVQELVEIGAAGVVILGASNGTTSALDYAVWSAAQGAEPEVRALGMMTGGDYTENQNPFGSVPELPVVFTYSTAEAAWSEAQSSRDPGSWSFLEYPGGAHGTRMFAAKPRVKRDLVAFFAEVLTE